MTVEQTKAKFTPTDEPKSGFAQMMGQFESDSIQQKKFREEQERLMEEQRQYEEEQRRLN